MLVTWSLFVMWVVFQTLDCAIAWVAIQHGATEVGFLYHFGSWRVMTINKMVLALLIGGILVYSRKDSWLVLLNIGMLGLCIYSGWVLLQQIAG